MEFDSCKGGEDGEHRGVGFVEIAMILATLYASFLWTNIISQILGVIPENIDRYGTAHKALPNQQSLSAYCTSQW